MKKEQLRKELLERGANGKTLLALQNETGLSYFRVPFEDVEYVGTIIVKVNEGLLEIPYRMVDIDTTYEELVIGAEQIVDKSRIKEIEEMYTSQLFQYRSFVK